MIIGVTGLYASGKDVVADLLKKQGFQHFSLSDEIRAEAKRRKIKLTRDNLINLGNELRAKYGPSILANRVRVQLRKEKDYVVTSIRNPEEVKALTQEPNFFLINVTANPRTRFERLKARAREEDPRTFKEFVEHEKIEQSGDPTKQQMHKTIKLAKITIKNDGTIEELQKKVVKLLSDLRKKYHRRPSWDDYFLGIVDAAAKRATCDRGRTAVILVRDKRILATGYVGSPPGAPHCDDAGHLMKSVVHDENYTSQHCVRTSHAEQNAISLAARNGIAIDGATLYSKLTPCYTCAKMLVTAGIKRVVCKKDYHAAQESKQLFKQTGVKLEILDKSVEHYSNQ